MSTVPNEGFDVSSTSESDPPSLASLPPDWAFKIATAAAVPKTATPPTKTQTIQESWGWVAVISGGASGALGSMVMVSVAGLGFGGAFALALAGAAGLGFGRFLGFAGGGGGGTAAGAATAGGTGAGCGADAAGG